MNEREELECCLHCQENILEFFRRNPTFLEYLITECET